MAIDVVLGGLVHVAQHRASHGDGHVFGASVAAHLAVERVHLVEEGGLRAGHRPHLLYFVSEKLVQPRDVKRVFVGRGVTQLHGK